MLALLGATVVSTPAIIIAQDNNTKDNLASEVKTYPFYGKHQSGIATTAQNNLFFAVFDLLDISKYQLIELLKDWTYASARITQGLSIIDNDNLRDDYNAAPKDSGELFDIHSSRLTLTFGFSPTFFAKNGKDKFGILHKKPKELKELPHFAGDSLNTQKSYGDICIQACADNLQVVTHAIRNLSRIAFGRASLRWSQTGFMHNAPIKSDATIQATPRNLFGFKDGTANIDSSNNADMNNFVWVNNENSWMNGGSYLISRTIRMTIETWDRTLLKEQERVIGRSKTEGSPLSGGQEFSKPDFSIKGRQNKPLIDLKSHLFQANSHTNGTKILRRSFNFINGNDDLGYLDAGLFFVSFQKSPEQFIKIQSNLSKNDAMNDYIKHIGSGIFAVPGGVASGEYIGHKIFE